MFAWWGRTVYRYRFIVIGVMVALSLLGGIFGMSLGKHVTQSGFYDDGSQSVKASVVGDKTYGRDRTSHIVAIFAAPKSINDPAWQKNDRQRTQRLQEGPPRPGRRLGRLAGRAEQHRFGDQGHGQRGRQAHVRQHPAEGRQRRHHPDQLQGHRARSAEAQRRQGPTRRPGADRQRADRDHRHRPEAHGGAGAAAGGGSAVPGVRRRDRRLAAGDRGWPEHRRLARHPALHGRFRPGALLRPARRVDDGFRYRDRLRTVHCQPVPRGDRRGL